MLSRVFSPKPPPTFSRLRAGLSCSMPGSSPLPTSEDDDDVEEGDSGGL